MDPQQQAIAEEFQDLVERYIERTYTRISA